MKKHTEKQPTNKRSTLWMWLAGIAILAAIIGAVFYRQAKPAQAALPSEVSPAEATQMQEEGAVILDVREADEWTAGHIAGAVLIPLGELPQRISEVPKDRDIVTVCRSGKRSAQGRDILLEAGYPSVTSLSGGMNAWIEAGYPVATDQ